MISKQIPLSSLSPEFKDYWKMTNRKVHGGAYAKGKRKTTRPFDTKKPIHLVLKSSAAKGKSSMSSAAHRSKVDATVKKYAAKFGIRIYEYSNNGNHLHLVLRAKRREFFQAFLRTIAGLIPRLILDSKKGQPKGRFWDSLAFTRVADWGRAYKSAKAYVIQNILEAAGVIHYTARKHRLVNLSG